MKKLNRIITAALAMACLMLCACGSKAEGGTVAAGQPQKSAAAKEEAAAPAAEESGAAETAEDQKTDVDEDVKEAAGSVAPDTFCFLSKDNDPYEIPALYSVNMAQDGKYSDLEGDIGDVLPQYKGVDLDGDGKADIIERSKGSGKYGEGYGYRIVFGDGNLLETGVFMANPNEGEVIEFCDLDGNGKDEILFTHYTDSTGGFIAWDVYLYYLSDKGSWECIAIEDEGIRLKEVADALGIAEGDEGGVMLRSVELADDCVALLVDHGMKSGPAQYQDYDAVSLKYQNGDLKLAEHSADIVTKYWPKLITDNTMPWGDVEIMDPSSCVTDTDRDKLKNLFGSYLLAMYDLHPDILDLITAGTIPKEKQIMIEEEIGYFQDFSDLKMYVINGYQKDSYIALAMYQVLLNGATKTFPRVEYWYICKNNNDSLYINFAPAEGKEKDFVENLISDDPADGSYQDDQLRDIYSDIVYSEYNQAVYGDPALEKLVTDMNNAVDERVAKRLEEEQ